MFPNEGDHNHLVRNSKYQCCSKKKDGYRVGSEKES